MPPFDDVVIEAFAVCMCLYGSNIYAVNVLQLLVVIVCMVLIYSDCLIIWYGQVCICACVYRHVRHLMVMQSRGDYNKTPAKCIKAGIVTVLLANTHTNARTHTPTHSTKVPI